MSKFACKCGYVIDLVKSPAPEEFMLVPQSNIDKAGILIDRGDLHDSDAYFTLIDDRSKDVLLCPNCGRVWIESDPGKFDSYIKECSDRS
jgi:hypothetical protein